jgi:hypothetical protein
MAALVVNQLDVSCQRKQTTKLLHTYGGPCSTAVRLYSRITIGAGEASTELIIKFVLLCFLCVFSIFDIFHNKIMFIFQWKYRE